MTASVREVPNAPPAIPSVPNFRDVGGHTTRDGACVRLGVLYRSGALDHLDVADERAVEGLGIRQVFDLRTAAERAERPDRLPAGVRWLAADLLAGSSEQSPFEVQQKFGDARHAAELLGIGWGEAFFTRVYREFVVLSGARAALHRVFTDLSDARRRPALIHCTTGKDRTGWAAAVLLLWLGVPEEAVVADFLASNLALEGTLGPMLAAFAADGWDPAVLRPLAGVLPVYLDAACVAMRRAYTDVDGYFRSGLGLDAATRRRLRDAFLQIGDQTLREEGTNGP